MKKKINFVPFILLFVMIFSIGGSFLFNYLNKIYGTFYWAKFIFNFVACELIIFHITPPFATLITFIVVNTNKKYYDSFWFKQFGFEKNLYERRLPGGLRQRRNRRGCGGIAAAATR